jgi:hypothetical protein
MVVILGKDKKMFKIISCQECGSELQYLPRDIMGGYYRTGNGDEVKKYFFIECPSCWEKVVVNV